MTDKPTYEELEQRVKKLQRQDLYLSDLHDIALELMRRFDLEDLLASIVQRAGELVETQDGFVYLLDSDRDVLELRVGVGRYKDLLGFHLKPGEGLSGRVWQSGEPLVIGDYSRWPGRSTDTRFDDVVTAVGVPLKVESRVVGVIGLNYFSRSKHFGNEELTALTRFAELASIALNNAQLYFKIQQELVERKTAEKALRDSERKLKAIFEATPNPVVVYDKKGHPQYLNPAFSQTFGWTLGDLQARHIPFVPADQEEITARKIKQLYDTQKPQRMETKRLTKSGRTLDILISAACISGPGEEPAGMVVTLTDITERKGLEAQLRHAQKMEAVGTLAGGIAHDFNNLLMGVQGQASLMLMDVDDADPHFDNLQSIERYIKRASELTRQLLGFARGGKYAIEPTDMNQLVKEQSRLFGRTRKEIVIHQNYEQDLWAVQVDQGQMEQVVLNVFINAWQAMPGGGDITIRTENVRLTKDFAKPYVVTPGKFVKISIADTGIGMDEDVRQRIFEPFFSTKGMGRGTGLGLASTYGIIQNHGGFINVESEKDAGTTFQIYLPAFENKVPTIAKTVGEVAEGTGNVLLVDDEAYILDIGRQLIGRFGYKVITADSGEKALEIYEQDPGAIDIVILDMIMPKLDGGKTYDRLKKIDPDVKVLLSSGYSITGKASEILKRGCNGFIQKPFDIRELSSKIKAVI